ncbi:MAG TPA: hypothetical protein VKZ41_09930 [Gemmatimonadales bacterium]|nr:hypothetical protein [Gemmatimonadales bacterium]
MAAVVLVALAACTTDTDGDDAVDSLTADVAADTVAAPGLREATGIDPADPFSVSPDAISAYLDETLQYTPAGSYWVQLAGDTPDSAQVRFEIVRGSHLISEEGFASDGHVIHRYILESRDRAVPAMGLSATDTLGYLYMDPGVVGGQRARYNARFVARTAEGGWRATETTLSVIPGASPPADVPAGSWMVWGAHDDDQYMQSRDALSREVFGRPYTMGMMDHCFLCGLMWCWVIDPD